MTSAIGVVWWLFLILALLVTLVDVYLLLRVVNLARQIRTLSARTVPAALGIARNTAVGESLGRTGHLVGALANQTGNVEALTGRLSPRLTQGEA